MFFTLSSLIRKKYFSRLVILSSLLSIFDPFIVLRNNSAVYGDENLINLKNIKWENLEINHDQNINWEIIKKNENNNFESITKTKVVIPKRQYKNEILLNSFNRSIVLNNLKSGPDVTFLVPLGFKSSSHNKFDFSIRGWNRRPPNSNLFAWNSGDAVAQIYYNIFNNINSSFGINIGLRSIYTGDLAGGNSPIGEGSSLGFRWDYKLSNNSGFALGAEQFIHFDNKTDTGRDIYVVYSKGKSFNKNNLYPVAIFTGGIGTGYLALWEKTKFACSDLFGGSGVDVNSYNQLCWGPFGAFSIVLNEKFSTFVEYNNYSLMLGSSYNPFKKLRLTFGLTLAESFDDYKVKSFDELRWFSRFSIGL